MGVAFIDRFDRDLEIETAPTTAGITQLAPAGIDAVVDGDCLPTPDRRAFLGVAQGIHGCLPSLLLGDGLAGTMADQAVTDGTSDYVERDRGPAPSCDLAQPATDGLGNRLIADGSGRNGDASAPTKIEALHAAAADILGCRTLEAAYQRTVAAAEDILDFDLCCMMIYEDGMLVPKAVSSKAPPDGARPMEPDEGEAGLVYQTREPRITVDTLADEVAQPTKDSYRSGLSVPTHDVGVFQAVATEPDWFSEEDLEFVELLLSYTETVIERLRFEQELKEERDRFGALFEHTSDCIAVLDWVDGEWIVRRVNPSFVETFGYEPDAIVGEPIDDFVTPSSAMDEAREINRRAKEGEATKQEVRRQTVDGVREFLLRTVSYRYRDQVRGSAVYTDITERKQAERRFRRLIEHSNDLITVIDPDGTIQYQTPSLERILGYDPDEAVGNTVFETMHPDDRDHAREQFIAAIEEPDLRPTMVYRVRHADGSWRYLESVGSNHLNDPAVAGYVVNSRDVTEREKRERLLERLHAATRELMAADTMEAIAESATATATDILGLPVNGVHLYDATVDGLVSVATAGTSQEVIDDPPTVYPGEALAWQVYETGEPQFHGDLHRDGGRYDPDPSVRSECLLPLGDHGVFMVSSTVPDDFDETDVALAKILAANVETALDRAERRRELEERSRELQRQNDRLEEFASVVAHDLRNPLNVAHGRLELAREGGDPAHLESAERALDRMNRIIDDMLTLARQGRTVGEAAAVALDRVANTAWANVESTAATLEVETDRAVEADEGRLIQLLENLFRNAVEHGGDGVIVRVGTLDPEPGFYVEDTGPGIPDDDRKQVFESGYTTRSDGTGFGLAIVTGIAEAHGWTVSVTDGAGGGARFEVVGVDFTDSDLDAGSKGRA